MLATALKHAQRQRQLTDAAVQETRRTARRGLRLAARMVIAYQAEAIGTALAAAGPVLEEQGIDTAQVARVDRLALVTDAVAVTQMMEQAAEAYAFDRLVRTLVSDAARTASSVDVVTRPAVTGHVRVVSTPCCSRCALLAGRVYRWSTGFLRHPGCGCQMVPTSRASGEDLTTDPDSLFRAGHIRDLSRADTKALNSGADFGRIVNVRSKKAGLVESGSVLSRGNRPTPAGIFRSTSNRDEALGLLKRHGYIL